MKDDIEELRRKAEAYEKMIASRSAGGKKAWKGLSAEERSARARKAAEARWKAKNQTSADSNHQ